MMLYRAFSTAGNAAYPAAKSKTCALGPPPLKNNEPSGVPGPVARCLITATLIVAP